MKGRKRRVLSPGLLTRSRESVLTASVSIFVAVFAPRMMRWWNLLANSALLEQPLARLLPLRHLRFAIVVILLARRRNVFAPVPDASAAVARRIMVPGLPFSLQTARALLLAQ